MILIQRIPTNIL